MLMAVETNQADITKSQIWVHNKNDEHSHLKSDAVSAASPEIDSHGEDDKFSSSEASEIANLADVSLTDGFLDSKNAPFDDTFAEIKKQEEIMKIIETAKLMSAASVDLSKRKLQNFPDALSQFPQLEYMYLEGNEIVSLPEEFFKMFPNLRWLDLRNNLLSRIPSAYLSTHSCLRNLLLEGNNLRNLPLELGLVKSLHGLNIAGNPLDFPPLEIIEKGTQYILCFLRELSEIGYAHLGDFELKLSEEAPHGCDHMSVSSDDWNTTASMMDLAKKREILLKNKCELNGNPEVDLTQEPTSEANPGKLHKPSYNTKTKHLAFEKAKKAGPSQFLDRKKKQVGTMSWKINSYPPLPTEDYVTFKMNEEKHLAKVKELKEKIDTIIQRQKDKTVLSKWRDVSKVLQQKKYTQRLQPGKDYKEPGEQAPFGIDAEMMKVLSKEDRLKAELQKETELKQQRQVSPTTRARREQEKQKRILELEQMIKVHVAEMVERRKLPKGTPQHEMELARKELQIAEQLHSELFAQRRDVEYHIKAFPADSTKRAKRNKHPIK